MARVREPLCIPISFGSQCVGWRTSPGVELYSLPVTEDVEREKDKAWGNFYRESGWVFRICSAVPERGQLFTDGCSFS